ncbi:MAG: dTMP kinase, partial [Candidatus Aenigmatarchaeota archaeon]
MRGRFITIEGIDGAGGETQSKALVAYLKKKGIKAVRLSYPDSSGLIGKLIYTWLSSSYELKPNILFLLYASDMLKDAEKIKRYVKSGYWVIADRWFGSTLAYQGTEIGLNRALQFARIFDIPKPDVNILLRISPEESMR